MTFLKTKILAGAMSALILATSFAPAQAFMPVQAKATEASQPLVPVQYYRPDANGDVINGQYQSRNQRRYLRQERRQGYYNGYRGYRERRPGYRQYNGFWFPLGAFAAGAILGGALNDQPAVRYGGRHTEWCLNRYRSYDVRSNTFQPNYGPRKACNSPYS